MQDALYLAAHKCACRLYCIWLHAHVVQPACTCSAACMHTYEHPDAVQPACTPMSSRMQCSLHAHLWAARCSAASMHTYEQPDALQPACTLMSSQMQCSLHVHLWAVRCSAACMHTYEQADAVQPACTLMSRQMQCSLHAHYEQAYAVQHYNRPPTPYKNKVNNCKLIYLVTRIELTQAILMPRFSNYLWNSNIIFSMFLYLVTCFLRVTVSLLCWSQSPTILSPFSIIR